MKLLKKHIISGNSVQSLYQICENDTEYFLVPVNQIIKLKKSKTNLLFDSKFDAMYSLLVHRLQTKKSTLKNYKSSKFFKQYIKRLQLENPELIF